jgi:hypothetical protein
LTVQAGPVARIQLEFQGTGIHSVSHGCNCELAPQPLFDVEGLKGLTQKLVFPVDQDMDRTICFFSKVDKDCKKGFQGEIKLVDVPVNNAQGMYELCAMRGVDDRLLENFAEKSVPVVATGVDDEDPMATLDTLVKSLSTPTLPSPPPRKTPRTPPRKPPVVVKQRPLQRVNVTLAKSDDTLGPMLHSRPLPDDLLRLRMARKEARRTAQQSIHSDPDGMLSSSTSLFPSCVLTLLVVLLTIQ